MIKIFFLAPLQVYVASLSDKQLQPKANYQTKVEPFWSEEKKSGKYSTDGSGNTEWCPVVLPWSGNEIIFHPRSSDADAGWAGKESEDTCMHNLCVFCVDDGAMGLCVLGKNLFDYVITHTPPHSADASRSCKLRVAGHTQPDRAMKECQVCVFWWVTVFAAASAAATGVQSPSTPFY